MYSSNVEVDILVNGRPIRKYSHQGRTFVKAEHWTEYAIKIRNNGSQRKLAIVCVDGVNVLDGEAGGSTKAGYVINGYSTYEVKGYRTSNEVVHPFKFNAKERSYAAQADVTDGSTQNCGVIGVEIYCEKEKPEKSQPQIREVVREVIKPVPYVLHYEYQYLYPYSNWSSLSSASYTGNYSCDSTITYSCNSSNISYPALGAGNTSRAMNCCDSNMLRSANVTTDWGSANALADSPKRGFDMGTEYSEKEVTDKVVDVEFEIGYLVHTFTFYYASHASLIEMGVPLTKDAAVAFPEPFPAKFCRPPNKSKL